MPHGIKQHDGKNAVPPTGAAEDGLCQSEKLTIAVLPLKMKKKIRKQSLFKKKNVSLEK